MTSLDNTKCFIFKSKCGRKHALKNMKLAPLFTVPSQSISRQQQLFLFSCTRSASRTHQTGNAHFHLGFLYSIPKEFSLSL